MTPKNKFYSFVAVGVFALFFICGGGLDGPSKPSLAEVVSGELTP